MQILRRKEKDDRNPLCTRRKQKAHTGSDVARVIKVRVPNRATRVGSENWILEERDGDENRENKENKGNNRA